MATGPASWHPAGFTGYSFHSPYRLQSRQYGPRLSASRLPGSCIARCNLRSRFKNRDRFADCNGTALIEVASGKRKVNRLSRRGNRRVSHAIHMAAVTQVRQKRSEGRACYDKKLTEGKTPREALRSLKRQVSAAVFTRLRADAQRAQAQVRAPGGQ
jgi:hypothetical protein